MVKTSVIICTYNRCKSLAMVLASAACLVLPDNVGWEVLVVDNDSSDETREIVDGFRVRYPGRFRYLFEPRHGKSHAANRGIQEAKGDVLAFIDDDVTVEPSWLHNLTASLHEGPWVGAGGQILPPQHFSPPSWIPVGDRYALAPLAIFNPDLAAGALAEPPYGANMAFQRRVFENYGGFRTDLGPDPGADHPQKSEDSEFGHRLLAGGERLRYEPSAIVYHAVPTHRLQQRYFLEWWFDKGRADVMAFGVPADTSRLIAGIPLYNLVRFAVCALRWMAAFDERKRFGAKVRVWSKWGEILECRQLSRESPLRR